MPAITIGLFKDSRYRGGTMYKLFAILAGIAAFFSGCQATKMSPAWKTVKAASHPRPRVPERARAYAQELHKSLRQARVEHKVVTFTFTHTTASRVNATGEGTAVIYRDSGTPAHPWWLMEEKLFSPVWLPSEALERQVAFHLQRPVSIVKVEEYPAPGAKKSRPSGKAGKSVVRKHRRTVHAKPGAEPDAGSTSVTGSRPAHAVAPARQSLVGDVIVLPRKSPPDTGADPAIVAKPADGTPPPKSVDPVKPRKVPPVVNPEAVPKTGKLPVPPSVPFRSSGLPDPTPVK